MTPNPNPSPELREARNRLSDFEQMNDAQAGCVPCKLCGGKAIVTDAGTGAGYYVRCENSTNFRDHKGCMLDERRLSGWAYNVMGWWNRLHSTAALTPPTPAETVTVALPGAGEVWSLDLDRREIYLGNQMLFKVYSCDDFWHVEGVASKDRQWFDAQAKAAVLTLNTLATVAAANDEGVAKAIEALKPLADVYLTGSEPDDGCVINASDFPNAGHARAARAAIRLLSQGGGK